MKKSLLFNLLLILPLIGCASPQQQNQPPETTTTKAATIPENQREDYLRIVGDLRWDKMTTIKDWNNRFPGCFQEISETYADRNLYEYPFLCRGINIGEVRLTPAAVSVDTDARTPSGSALVYVLFGIKDGAQKRAFDAAIRDKYPQETVLPGRRLEAELYCSKYTCWHLTGGARATPTNYTISILERVKIDKSKL